MVDRPSWSNSREDVALHGGFPRTPQTTRIFGTKGRMTLLQVLGAQIAVQDVGALAAREAQQLIRDAKDVPSPDLANDWTFTPRLSRSASSSPPP
jgi:hypothetical protein